MVSFMLMVTRAFIQSGFCDPRRVQTTTSDDCYNTACKAKSEDDVKHTWRFAAALTGVHTVWTSRSRCDTEGPSMWYQKSTQICDWRVVTGTETAALSPSLDPNPLMSKKKPWERREDEDEKKKTKYGENSGRQTSIVYFVVLFFNTSWNEKYAENM